MGQEASHSQINPDDPPHTLSARSIEGIAEFIKSGQAKKIVVLTGAGISTSAGIPDFRSPETGIYAHLAELDLPYAEAVFDIDFFRENPAPFYVLAKELYPGKFYPTISHAFIALIEKKGLLRMLFTQNIDCLELRAGVPWEKVIEAHGSFATQTCIDCKTGYPDDMMKEAIEEGNPATCLVPQCGGLVKPDIVFFGEQLPEAFHRHRMIPATADLVIVMGTSLSVQPFAMLPSLPPDKVPRLLFNKISVGDFGSRLDDVVVLGDCDTGVRKLADALGWREELEELWMSIGGNTRQKEAEKAAEARLNMSRDERHEVDIEKLTTEIDEALKFSGNHTHRVIADLQKNPTINPAASPPPAEAMPTRASTEFTADKNSLLVDIANGIALKEATTIVRSTPIIDEKGATIELALADLHSSAGDENSSVVLDATMPQNMPNSFNLTTNS
ncbi:57f0fbaf-e28d-4eba-aadf-a6cde2323348 [Sclerotinia trifoliorum]|uniref:57f0fbaf-e28d-4eba-aadf-a6cde2323348 n=1 Tax=Sclerotinia trifoliorum TaxID=28548 RepID=A0A8H2ZQX5_9HELO|nr:57f0fbaf-e28d-4eba-aadf-a6cde2323348 [Sclerotinia trifoliorum]